MGGGETGYPLGSMFWAKVATYPWWPCMIYNSPNGDGCIKILKTITKHHVQFFGPSVERAWVADDNLIPYRSNRKLESQLEKLCTDNPAQGSKYQLKVSTSQQNRWKKSCEEAEVAFQLPLEERIRRFGRIANLPKAALPASELKAMLLKNVDRIPLTIKEEAESLEAFLSAEKSRCLQVNPDMDEGELDKMLRLQWSGFDFATQRSYLSNKLAMFGLDSMVDKVTEETKERSTERSSVSGSDASLARKSVVSQPNKIRKQIFEEVSKLDAEMLRLIASPGPYRFQPVCYVCKETSNDRYVLLKCRSVCGRYWHPNCLPYSTASNKDVENPAKFVCEDCQSKKYICGVCGVPFETGDTSEMCSCQVRDCGKRYHRHCLESQPGVVLADGLVRCPSHVCATCCLENPKTSYRPGQNMIHCFSCPRVFHTGDLCTPAGSRELSLSHIICPAHLKTTKRTPSAPFCLSCRNSGSDRVNCESCPISYHRTCLDEMESGPELTKLGTLKCNNCSYGVQPRYAQVVWVKVHSCRWWPCEIIHSRNAPLNIYNLKHSDGEFVIHFIGSNEYGWVHQCQTFPFEYALGSPLAVDVPNANTPLDKAFNRALLEAPLVHRLYVSYLLKRGLCLVSMETKPLTDEQLIPLSTLEAASVVGILSQSEIVAKALDAAMTKFKRISSNLYTSSEEEELVKQPLPTTPCDCARTLQRQQKLSLNEHKLKEAAAAAHWRCSVDISCSNVLKNVECTPDFCSIMALHPSSDCGNRKFDHPSAVGLLLTTNRGVGLKVMHPVAKSALVIEYIGEVVETVEANRRLASGLAAYNAAAVTVNNTELLPSTYLLRFTSNLVIDASQVGNEARFINHSCEPNAIARVSNVNGILRMGIFAKKNIEVEEEVTIDYRNAQLLDCYFMNSTNVCVCGSGLCDGFVKLPYKFPSTEKKRSGSTSTSMALPTLRGSRCSDVTRRPTETKPQLRRSPEAKSVSSPLGSLSGRSPRSYNSTAISHHLLSAAATEKSPPTKIAPGLLIHCTPKVVITKRLAQPLHDEYCFRCGDGGEMILCNRASCSRVYHLGCLGLSAPPIGNWHCPWHFCDICGKPAIQLCCRCPNSFCLDHSLTKEGNELIRVHDLDSGRWHNTLKLLGKCSSDPVEMAKMIAALIFRCQWVCYVHEQAKITPPNLATVANVEGCRLLHGSPAEHVEIDNGERSNGGGGGSDANISDEPKTKDTDKNANADLRIKEKKDDCHDDDDHGEDEDENTESNIYDEEKEEEVKSYKDDSYFSY